MLSAAQSLTGKLINEQKAGKNVDGSGRPII
jgi:hypothetical protein